MGKVEDIAKGWDEAFASDRPVIVEARTDSDTFILPPHISLQEARMFAATLIKGDPDELSIMGQEAKVFLQGILPHKD
jgi:pyruvate dehydrogenase (quinone)